MPQIRYILFDFFGTLVETPEGQQISPCESYGPLAELLPTSDRMLFDRLWWAVLDEMVAHAKETQDEFSMYDWARLVGLRFEKTKIPVPILEGMANAFMDIWESGVQVCQDSMRVIPILRQEYTLGVISNTSYEPLVPGLLSKFGLAHYFDCIVTSVALGKRKPAPEIFRSALRQLKARPEECCFVGDNYEEDIVGAKAAGINAIQICRKKPQPGTIASLDELLTRPGEPAFSKARMV